jgi:hypothetical protein
LVKGRKTLRPEKPKLLAKEVFDKLSICEVGLMYESALYTEIKECTHEEIMPTKTSNDADSVAFKFNDFSKNHRLKGKERELGENIDAGHVRVLQTTAEYIASKLAQAPGDVMDKFRALAGASSEDQQLDAKIWLDDHFVNPTSEDEESASPIAICGNPCWLFLGNSEQNPKAMLGSTDAGELPYRLGLPNLLTNKELLAPIEYLGYIVPATKLRSARMPSVFDGDYDTVKMIWSPGGWTVPWSWGPVEAVGKGGLLELVADPPFYTDLTSDFFVFMTTGR